MTSNYSDLFRLEAVQSRYQERWGKAILIRPLGLPFFVVLAAVIAVCLMGMMFFASYTKRTQVIGVLTPEEGIIKVYTQQPGVVTALKVTDGQHVKRGDSLYVISLDHRSAGGGASQSFDASDALMETIKRRQEDLADEGRQETALYEEQRLQLSGRANGLSTQDEQLRSQIQLQRQRVASAKLQYDRYKGLVDQHIMAAMAAQQKEDELLDQQGRLRELLSNQSQISAQLASTRSDLAQLPAKHEQQVAEIRRQLSELQESMVEMQTRSNTVIAAPESGLVTAIMVKQGQIAGNEPLLTIVPDNAVFRGELYVPSKAIGFIEPGQRVRMRFAPYPYEKFGQYGGRVLSISQAALLPREGPALLENILQKKYGGEGVYEVDVELDKQTVTAYGKEIPLTAGIQIEADIMQDRRTLVEWMLEPLYSLRGVITR